MDLLAAEITARTGKDPGEHYRELTAEFGTPYYTRIDAPATPEQKARLEKLSPAAVKESELAGEPITAKLTRAPGNNAPIGGLKVVAASGWFAARPSGTEDIYKIYAESFKDQAHLDAIVSEAQEIVNNALKASDPVPGRQEDDHERQRLVRRVFPRSRRNTAPPACCCTSRRCPRPTALATWGRLRWRGSTASTRRGKAWWQALPLGPTGYGNSPYQSLSSFAGNELLISPDGLIEDGLLRAERLRGPFVPGNGRRLRRGHSVQTAGCSKRPGPTSAPGRAPDLRPAFDQFCDDQAHWLDDYALFRALKARYNGAYYLEWPAELVRRDPAALDRGSPGPGEPNRSGSLRTIPVVPPGGAPQGTRPRQGRALDRRPALFRFPRFERCLGQPGVVPARRAAQAALRGRRASGLLQLARDSSGATPSTTGTHFVVPAIAGASTDCAPCWPTSTRFAWIISAASRPPGTCRPERRRRSRASGCRVPGAEFFSAVQKELGGLPFIAEDLGLITPDVLPGPRHICCGLRFRQIIVRIRRNGRAGASKVTRRRLMTLAAEFETGGTIAPPPRPKIKPGSRLVQNGMGEPTRSASPKTASSSRVSSTVR